MIIIYHFSFIISPFSFIHCLNARGLSDGVERGIEVQILCTLDFRRGLSPPVGGRTFLVQACIHPYEVDEIEADWLAVLIHSPRDVDATAFYVP